MGLTMQAKARHEAVVLLQALVKSAKPQPRQKRDDEAELIQEHGIREITPSGFTVPLEIGLQEIELDHGWTEEHYARFAPLLDPWERSRAAKFVLVKQLRRAGCQEVDTAWWLLCEKLGHDEEDWLPSLVENNGFAAVAAAMSQEVAEYRKLNPRRESKWVLMDRPHFDGMHLWWGDKKWTFRSQRGPVRLLLEALERNQWRPVHLSTLNPDQVHEAARFLRKKTMPHLNWHASNNGLFSW
jgi:hypothetical protein